MHKGSKLCASSQQSLCECTYFWPMLHSKLTQKIKFLFGFGATIRIRQDIQCLLRLPSKSLLIRNVISCEPSILIFSDLLFITNLINPLYPSTFPKFSCPYISLIHYCFAPLNSDISNQARTFCHSFPDKVLNKISSNMGQRINHRIILCWYYFCIFVLLIF